MKSIEAEKELLQSVMMLIAKQFGNKCEVVLHSWSEGYEKSIIAIENGHVSGRKVGGTGSNLGLEVMRGTSDGSNQYNYITRTKDGRTLRSSSLYLTNDEGEKIGALCINYDITDVLMAQEALDAIANTERIEDEKFVDDVSELLEFLLLESVKQVGRVPEEMGKEDKMRAIKFLDEKGALLISKSGARICKFFGISKYTLYNYLDAIREEG